MPWKQTLHLWQIQGHGLALNKFLRRGVQERIVSGCWLGCCKGSLKAISFNSHFAQQKWMLLFTACKQINSHTSRRLPNDQWMMACLLGQAECVATCHPQPLPYWFVTWWGPAVPPDYSQLSCGCIQAWVEHTLLPNELAVPQNTCPHKHEGGWKWVKHWIAVYAMLSVCASITSPFPKFLEARVMGT